IAKAFPVNSPPRRGGWAVDDRTRRGSGFRLMAAPERQSRACVNHPARAFGATLPLEGEGGAWVVGHARAPGSVRALRAQQGRNLLATLRHSIQPLIVASRESLYT